MSVYSFQLTRPRKARRLCIYHLSVPSWNFNSRAHARRDENCLTASPRIPNFNSRAHARRDFPYTRKLSSMTYFNSRAHARRDQIICNQLLNLNGFQLTRPRKARLFVYPIFAITSSFQLTRPRKARPVPPVGIWIFPEISTHAPTQGATKHNTEI